MSEREFCTDDLDNFPQVRKLTQHLIGHPGFIAGGCFKHLFYGEKVHDIDMFFECLHDWKETVSFFTKSEDYVEKYRNNNVVAFIHVPSKTTVECVRKIFGTPEDILSQFDFTITKMAYVVDVEPPEDEDDDWHYYHYVVYHPKFFEHMLMRRLVVDDAMPYPLSTFNRTYKYARYGYYPCVETKLKIAKAIFNLPDVPELLDIGKAFYEGHD